MCNVEKMFKLTGGDLITQWEDYCKLQEKFCEFLRQQEKED